MRIRLSLYPALKSIVYSTILMTAFLFMGVINPVKAQKGEQVLIPLEEPHFGRISLSEDFTPDPHNISVVSGGPVNVSNQGLCSDCTGYASSAPDVVLNWTGSAQNLRILFVADDASEDATLIINTPDGSWLGNDDANSNTLNPMIALSGHGAGLYQIWVGSLSSGVSIDGTLTITELSQTPEGIAVENPLDPSGDPSYGTVSLTEGFSPDPHDISVVSGGPVNVSNLGLCSDCTGFASVTPDVKLDWTGSAQDLRILFVADDSSEDATLIINTPDGSWLGNDDADSNTLNPMIALSGHGAGRYDIWVGSYSSGASIDGTLTITELSQTAVHSAQENLLRASNDPHFGTVSLSKGFSDDPHTVRVVTGGTIDVSQSNICSSCTGYVSSSPDIRFNWSGGSDELRIYFEADEKGKDATLIINTPSGTWIGNDDAYEGTVNPMLLLSEHGEGQYDIWVGSYSSGESINGTLTITELSKSPR